MESLVCPEKTCGRKFTRSFNLNRHYQNFHLNSELVEKCFLCAQLFPSCEELQKHYSRFHRPSRKFFLKESAFKRSFVTYRYNYMEQDINFASSQLNIKEKIEERLLSEAALKTVCKTSLIFIAQMAMLDHSGNVLSEASIPFRSPSFLVTTSSKSNLRKNIKKSFAFQQSSLDEFLRNGSGWRFNRALAFDIEVARVRPITGGNNTNLNLKNFRQKIFLYNPCNKDEKCFLYCIAHYLYQDKLTETEKKKREEKKYKKFIKRFDIANISFPISISGIKKFLKQNQHLNLKINILYRDTKDRIFPLEYGLGNGKNIATLLMVEKKSSNHFVLITNPNKYLRSVYRTSNGSLSYERAHFCLHCLNSFCRADLLKKHEKLCLLNNPKAETTPEKGSKHEKIQFKNFEKCHKLEFTGYLDFECVQNSKDKTTVCHTCERLKCTCDASFTEVISKQIPIAFSFLVLGPDKQIIHEYSFAGKNAHEHLIEHLLEQEETWIENLLTTKEEMIMTNKNTLDYNKATNCYLCFEEFSDTVLKVRDHCHYNSKFLGAACSTCNLRRRKPRKIPIFMHNGSRFDLHFIVKALGKFPEDVKNISVLPYNGENFRTLSFNCFEFVDSLAFLQASLSQLSTDLNKSGHDYPILKQTSLVNTDKKFDKEKYQMILGKSFFPYEYCKNLPQMYASKKLPSIEHFYSQLSEKSISKEDHKFAKTVWKKFKCRHLVDYTLIYCKIDVLLLSEIFESFRDEMIQFSGLDPAHYISLPAYTFDSMLKTTNAVFELPTDIDMVHFLENAKRGGMSIIGTRHLTPSCPATSKTKKSGLEEEESELIYIDANVIYHLQNIFLPQARFELT
jgi:hypothetical protein